MSEDAYEVECVVIGAGVVGLACAAALAEAGREVIVVEATGGIGNGISSRNSEVIHGGLYYPTGSLKHTLCVEGRRKLYPYLASRNVAHKKCGKLIVATNLREEAEIAAIYSRALANDVENVTLLTSAEAKALEPNLKCVSALLSPETGIVDSHGLMQALEGDAASHSASVVFNTPFLRGEAANNRFVLHFGGDAPMILTSRILINAAGLDAPSVAARLEGLDAAHIPQQYLAKGSYFACVGKPAFQRLIYPAPADGGLGVHLTLDLAGQMRFGPDVEWLDERDPARVNYAVDPQRAQSFYAAIRSYWPDLADDALAPAYAGCRPKLSERGAPAADFRIDGPDAHGVAGLINLFGIESPGLTSSLAIAERVRAAL